MQAPGRGLVHRPEFQRYERFQRKDAETRGRKEDSDCAKPRLRSANVAKQANPLPDFAPLRLCAFALKSCSLFSAGGRVWLAVQALLLHVTGLTLEHPHRWSHLEKLLAEVQGETGNSLILFTSVSTNRWTFRQADIGTAISEGR